MTEREPIRLDQFMKRAGMVQTGGEAKVVIQSGQVTLNGEVEVRRSKKLYKGDVVCYQGVSATVD
ncbi:MAG: RNA-binding S4 domain-containing protein [Chloroflexi bacterium]|nr:RNA-binding S4 domain-containing protein [Chloroflexota bacterium]